METGGVSSVVHPGMAVSTQVDSSMSVNVSFFRFFFLAAARNLSPSCRGMVATHLPWNSSYARRGMRATEDEWSASYVVRSLLSLRCEEPLSELSWNGSHSWNKVLYTVTPIQGSQGSEIFNSHFQQRYKFSINRILCREIDVKRFPIQCIVVEVYCVNPHFPGASHHQMGIADVID